MKKKIGIYLLKRKKDNIKEEFMGIFPSSISEYARTDYSECFAEAFADVVANGIKASPFFKKIKEITTIVYRGD